MYSIYIYTCNYIYIYIYIYIMNHDTRYDVNPTLYSNVGKPAGESYQIITKQFLVNPGPGLDLPLGTWLLRGLGSSPGVRHGW